MANEGFAEPWLKFEEEMGKRLMLKGPDIATMNSDYAEMGGLLVSKLSFPAPDPSVQTRDVETAAGLKIRVYTPPSYAGDKPVCVFFHAGGWAMGSINDEDGMCRDVARDAGVVIVSVEYRLAPEFVYPAGLDDCVAGYKWALENATTLKTTPGKAFTFGTSAGGGLAISTALRVIDAGLKDSLVGVVAITPVTCHPDAVPKKYMSQYTSYDENSHSTINSKAAMKVFSDIYEALPTDPYTYPILHKKLDQMPRTYILSAGKDTLRDDSRIFEAELNEVGVPNKGDEFVGYPHFFWAYPSKHLFEVKKEFDEKLLAGIKFVLQ